RARHRHPRDPPRHRVHRLLHELSDRGPACSGRRGPGPRRARRPARARRSRLGRGQDPGRAGGPRRGLHRRRIRVARRRLLDVPGHEPRHPVARRAERLDEQSQLRGSPGQGRAYAPREPACRGRDRDRGTLHDTGGSVTMEPIARIDGTALPLDRADVDTDQIIPAQYLKRIERTGFGPFLFDEWRKDPSFVLNDERYDGATILLTGPNFGSGSSREHAPWAIEDYGFKAVISPSFADIFRNNCLKIGLLPVELRDESVRALMDAVLDDPSTRIEIDLEARTVRAPGLDEVFDMEEYSRWRLLEG